MIKIRRAELEDAKLLAEIGLESFISAFADDPRNAPEDMKIFVAQSFGEAIQARELQNEKIVFFIVEFENEVAGYCKLHLDAREEMVTGAKCLEIARFYLLENFIGRGGIAGKMMEFVLNFARENNFETVWLGVWEFNPRAQKFYQKWGFEHAGSHVFQFGGDAQTDWVWQRKI